jgi:hypothetical protein
MDHHEYRRILLILNWLVSVVPIVAILEPFFVARRISLSYLAEGVQIGPHGYHRPTVFIDLRWIPPYPADSRVAGICGMHGSHLLPDSGTKNFLRLSCRPVQNRPRCYRALSGKI